MMLLAHVAHAGPEVLVALLAAPLAVAGVWHWVAAKR